MQVPVSVQHFLNSVINGPARYTQSHHFSPWLALVFVLGILFAEFIPVFLIGLALFTFLRNLPALYSAMLRRFGIGEKEAPYTFLELTIPADTSKSAFATEQLHILLQNTVLYYGLADKMAAHKKPYSLELVATNDDGIRFIIMIASLAVDMVRHDLVSFLPGIKIQPVEDYTLSLSDEGTQVVELRLNGDFILPLKDHKALEEHDFMAYITGQMTKLHPGEVVAYQIVGVPVLRRTHHRVLRRVRHIEARLSLGKEVWSQIEPQRTPLAYALRLLWYPPLWLLHVIGKIITFGGGLIFAIIYPELESSHRNKEKRRSDNPYDIEMGRLIKSKLDQQLYEVTIRVLVSSPDGTTHHSRVNALIGSFGPFRTTYQSIGVRQSVPFVSPRSKQLEQYKQRKLANHHLSQQTILSSSELSDLYHFPNTDLTGTEGFVKSRSRELAAPLSVKHSTAKLDVVVGMNEHGGDEQPVGMTLGQRQKHTYIIGKTGTGKTTLLKSSIYQDMVDGKGLAVLDPHGDMFQELLEIVPEHRRKDVVVFDPSDEDFPPGLNILDPGITFKSEKEKHQRITGNVLSVFEKLADEKQWGPRMEHILRSATMTALQAPNPSLYTLQRLLTEKKYQRQVAATLKDPVLRQFWRKEFALLGTMQMSNAVAPLTHRLGHFITTPMSRHILLQEKSTVRISEIMDQGKILLVNLSKGDIGEDQSFFFGTILTSFIWMAAYQRNKVPEAQRRDFFLYVDEFQNFATPGFSEISSEGRKYHVPLIISHQNIAQIEDKSLLKVMVGNAHTIICLKASPEDEAFMLPYMAPVVEKGGIVNLAPYHFYMKTTHDTSEDAFSGVTVPLTAEALESTKEEVIANSRKQYCTPIQKVEKYLDKLFGQEEPKKNRSDKNNGKNEPSEDKDSGELIEG